MAYALVCAVALLASALTLLSGFGLGTLLMPAFAAFFPLEVAIAATAVVHMANNVMTLALVGKHADRRVLLRFMPPAIAAAVLGALTLLWIGRVPAIATYTIGASTHEITVLKIAIAAVILAFAIIELHPRFDQASVDPKWAPLGGAISGFFGGLSGHQGALRSAFLLRFGLSKQAYIGTGRVIAVGVDAARLGVYALGWSATGGLSARAGEVGWGLLAAATACAFAGAYVGSKLIPKVTMKGVRVVVGVMLLLFAGALGAGLV